VNSQPGATYSAEPAEDAAGMSAAPRRVAKHTLRQSKVAQRAPDGRGDALNRGQPPFDYQLDGTPSTQLLYRMALSSRMPDLESFEVFLAIAETGSLGNAARELGLTQQAVSRRLASMEAKVGVTLAARTTRGSTLTPAGTVMAQWASRLLDVAHDIDAGLGSLREEGCQRIKVVASQTIADYLMPQWLLSLRAANSQQTSGVPEVSLTATNSEHAIASVRGGAADLGFVEKPGSPAGLGSCVVGHDELVIVVPPSHKWARNSQVVSARELAETPLVTREPRAGIRNSLAVALRRSLGDDVQQAPPVLELPTAAALRGAVVAGAGPAVMSRLAVADDLAVGRLRAITVSHLDLRRELRAIWVGGRAPPAGAIRNFLTHISTRTKPVRR
jgi:DNA-binding transcriptional LysR family regulator